MIILKTFSLISALILTGAGSASAQSSQTRVMVENGEIEGRISNNLKVFKGIPYAKSPVGDLRWELPQPVEK